MEPIKLKPVLKDYIWGGDKLKKIFKDNFASSTIAEAWLISANNDGMSFIEGGELDEVSFLDYLENNKASLGKNAAKFDYFPILSKLIDAKQSLSVQVHPDDAFAMKHENSYGKNEMWYVLACDDDAFIYYGLNRDVSVEEFNLAVKNGSLEALLNKVYTKKGDVFFIEAGTIHAIGKGNLIVEIQQNSNITYRLYDYNRADDDNNKRELHLDKGSLVANLKKTNPAAIRSKNITPQCALSNYNMLFSSKYFTAIEINVFSSADFWCTDKSFTNLIVLEGSGKLIDADTDKVYSLSTFDSYYLPAKYKKFDIQGNLKIILISV